MSTETEVQGQTETTESTLSFLDRAIEATTQTPADTTKELFSVLTEQALSGTVTWDKNLTKTIENAISEIDNKLSKQLSEVMQQQDFQKLEGSWRGLQKLVKESELSPGTLCVELVLMLVMQIMPTKAWLHWVKLT